jgi:hypothetical protein
MHEIQFSAYYPKEVTTSTWQPLYAYMLRRSAQSPVQKDAREQLGTALSSYREHSQPASRPLSEGAVITATPQLEGFQFNPPSLTMGLYEEWHRFDFKLRATEHRLHRSSNGLLTFTCEGIIVADIPLSIFVGQRVSEPETEPAHYNLYDAVFCSYSHQDEAIVQRVELACQALGLQYLRDVTTLRSGQKWDEELLNMIDRSDIFQLFWSPSAAQSPYVTAEWQHALAIGRDAARFIRPVYWQKPMPTPPEQLVSIHFAYTPQLARG